MASFDYDLFVIGGGSGGVRAGRLAGAMGKKVGLAEEYRMGGTCVIRGCVPKKLYVYASQFPEHFDDAAGYGWSVGERKFDWNKLVEAKNREISRLEGLYRKGLENSKVDIFNMRAKLLNQHTVELADGRQLTAERILIATGGRPAMGDSLPGIEHCISSDEAFDLPQLPKSIFIAGGGYIAVEFANIFHGLGVETTIVYRGKEILSRFDPDLRDLLHKTMEAKGIRVICGAIYKQIEKLADGRRQITLSDGSIHQADQAMLAIGRQPNTENLGLEAAGVAQDEATGAIIVDEYSRTSAESVWAVGDVTNRVALTPVAIHESMCFLETEFKNNPTRPDHKLIPTAVFSQPEIGTIGLPEDVAAKKYSELEVYRALFRPMRHTLSGRDEKMLMKLIVDAESRKVVGAHIMGPDAGEMAQLLGISLKAGATKDDFDRTMAVHPTAAEELVTMYQPTYIIRNGERVGS